MAQVYWQRDSHNHYIIKSCFKSTTLSVYLESPFEHNLGVMVGKQLRLSRDAHGPLRDCLWEFKIIVRQEIHHDH